MKKNNLFLGLLFLLIAISLLASGFNLFQVGPSIFRLGITAVLFFVSISSLMSLNYFGIFMPLAVALIINQKFLNFYIQPWPILLGTFILSIALSILFKKKSKIKFEANFNHNDKQTIDGDNIKIKSNFNNTSRYIKGSNVSYVNAENNFGNLDIFFDEVEFNEHGANIKVNCNFGNVSLYLPKEYEYQCNIQTTLATVNEEVNNYLGRNINVYLGGEVNFGKVDIYYI